MVFYPRMAHLIEPARLKFVLIAKNVLGASVRILTALDEIEVEPWSPLYRQKLQIRLLLIAAHETNRQALSTFLKVVYEEAKQVTYARDERPEDMVQYCTRVLHNMADLLIYDRFSRWDVVGEQKEGHLDATRRIYHGEQYVYELMALVECATIALNADGLSGPESWLPVAHRHETFNNTEAFISALRILAEPGLKYPKGYAS